MSFVTKAKKDSQEKETLQIYKRCVINYCFFTVVGNKINELERLEQLLLDDLKICHVQHILKDK